MFFTLLFEQAMLLKLLFYTAILLIAILGYRSYATPTIHLKPGDKAPEFILNDGTGRPHNLSDYTGKYVILYFYPKNDTPTCTQEACHFRDNISQFEKLNAKVIGVSLDNHESHDQFGKKHRLPFPLLADTSGKVASSYNALTDLIITKLAKRHTFLIDPAGNIAKIYTHIDVANHSQQIMNDLKSLQQIATVN